MNFCKVALDAPCKVNLHLDVGERRLDGFHNIESVFQLISLCDTLSASKTDGGGCRVLCSEMSLPKDNTISRAFDVFRRQTGIKGGAAFELKKRVPAAAGLGGGSSDGAAALRALDALYGTGLSLDEMEAMALKIGSDCPFFIRGAPAFVSGRGEGISRFDGSKKLFGVLIWPDVASSTKEAYSLLDSSRAFGGGKDEEGGAEKIAGARALLEEYRKSPREWRFFNSFAPILRAKYSSINKALIDINAAGALFCSMTGSGSAVFGVFEAEQEADEAFAALSRAWQCCHKFFFLAFSPAVK